ncbi:hypothetical protein TcBrA4_0068470 [Trypanosoma cruzi]|nr:hypothetical protein TcBrA4_0068470 [Trypanosoma cruzi]
MSDETLTWPISDRLMPVSMDLYLKHGRILLSLDILRITRPSDPYFETTSAPARYGGSPELGHQQGLITAERERLNFDYANARRGRAESELLSLTRSFRRRNT